jgi:5-formyltetrahydrofolate cyclo-ligase
VYVCAALRVWERLRELPVFQSSTHVAVYLSVPGEIDTRPIVEHILRQPGANALHPHTRTRTRTHAQLVVFPVCAWCAGKVCYVPHTEAGEMKMLSVASLEDLNTFECRNNWGILEPPVDSIKSRAEGRGLSLSLSLLVCVCVSLMGLCCSRVRENACLQRRTKASWT